MRVLISKSKDGLMVALAALGALFLAALIFLTKTNHVDPEWAGLAMITVLALLCLGWFMHRSQQKKNEAAYTEEFGDEVPSDPIRRRIQEGVTNHHLKKSKSDCQTARKEKRDLENQINKRKFISPDEGKKFNDQLDGFEIRIEEADQDFTRKHEIARKVYSVYVQAN